MPRHHAIQWCCFGATPEGPTKACRESAVAEADNNFAARPSGDDESTAAQSPPLQGASHACCSALAGLDFSSWPDRISRCVSTVESHLGTPASLAVFGLEPADSWIFDGGKGSFERHACLSQLNDGGAAACSTCSCVSCPVGGAGAECWSRSPAWLPALHSALTAHLNHLDSCAAVAVLSTRTGSVTVRPLPCSLGEDEVVALPVYRQRSGQTLAAVLLRACCWTAWHPPQLGAYPSAQQPHMPRDAATSELQSKTAATGAAGSGSGCAADPAAEPPATQFLLAREDAFALQRVAQMVGFGLFSDQDHSAFLAQVSAHLSAVAGSRSLHDAVHAVLDAVPELIRSRTSVTAHCLLAAMADAPGERLLGLLGTGTLASTASAAAPAALVSAGASNSNSASSSSRRVLRSPVALFCKRAVESAAGLAAAAQGVGPSGCAGAASDAQSNVRRGVSSGLAAGGPGNRDAGAQGAGGAGPSSEGAGFPDLLPHTQSLELQHPQLSSLAGHGASVLLSSQQRRSRVRAVRLPLPRTLLLQAMKEACPGVAYQQLVMAPSAPTYVAALPPPQRLRIPSLRVLPTGATASASSGVQPAPAAKAASPFANNTVAAVINNAAPALAPAPAAVVPATEVHASALWDASVSGAAGGRLPVTTMVIKDASAFLLDDVQQVYRDVLTGSLMASGGTDVGSVVLCLEGSMAILPPNPPPPAVLPSTHQHPHLASDPPSVASLPVPLRQQTSGLMQLPAAVALSSVAAGATPPLTPAATRRPAPPGGGGVTSAGNVSAGNVSLEASAAVLACGCVSGCGCGCGAALAQQLHQHGLDAQDGATAPAPGRLALYLVFAETLPAGVLQMVESELKQLMPLFFSALRCSISSSGATAGTSLVAADWRLLHMQLTGMRNVTSTLTSPLATASGFPADAAALAAAAAAAAAGTSHASSSAQCRCTPQQAGTAASAVPSGAAAPEDAAAPASVAGDSPPQQQVSSVFSIAGARSGGQSSRSSGDAGAGGPAGPSSVGLASMPRGFSALDQVPEDPSSREGSDGRANNNGSRSGSGLPLTGTGAAASSTVAGSPAASRAAPRSLSLNAANAHELLGPGHAARGTAVAADETAGALESVRSQSGSTTMRLQTAAVSGPVSTSRSNNNAHSGAAGAGHLQRALTALRARLLGGGSTQGPQLPPGTQPQQGSGPNSQQQQLPAFTFATGSVGSNPAGIEASNSSRFAKSLLRLASVRGAAAAAAVSAGGGTRAGSIRAAGAEDARGAAALGESGEARRAFLRTESGPAAVSDAAPQKPHTAAVGPVSVGPAAAGQPTTTAGPAQDASAAVAAAGPMGAPAFPLGAAKQPTVSVGLLADLVHKLPGPHRSSPALLLENESDPESAAIAAAVAAGEPPTRTSTGDLMNSSAGSAREAAAAALQGAGQQQQAQQQASQTQQAPAAQQQQAQRYQQQQQSTELLVSTVRSRLTAVLAGSEDSGQARAMQAQDLECLELLEVLGRGGQAVVLRGILYGLEIAVKVMLPKEKDKDKAENNEENPARAKLRQDNQHPQRPAGGKQGGTAAAAAAAGVEADPAEAPEDVAAEMELRQAKRGATEIAVSMMLSHPNIAQAYGAFSRVVVVRVFYANLVEPVLRLCQEDSPLLKGSDPGPSSQVLCLEYCDAGTLLAACRAGAFRLPTFPVPSGAGLVHLYTSLLEVALALRHLHSRRLVHCDVKAANVLLKSSTRDPRGWNCKLSDFGCVRVMSETAADGRSGFRVAQPAGTLRYMSPECFIKDTFLGAEVDVFAFGIMMFELLTGTTPYGDLAVQEIPRQVYRYGLRPVFPPLAPPHYCALAQQCWQHNPRHRPSASDLVVRLQQLQMEAVEKANAAAAAVAAATAAAMAAAPAAAPTPAGVGVGILAAGGMPTPALFPQPSQGAMGMVPMQNQ